MAITIALLIFTGLLLVAVEIFLTPGVGFAGIGGIGALVIAAVFSFMTYGPLVGSLVLMVVLAGVVLAVIYGFRKKTWEKLALKDVNDSRVNEDNKPVITLGEEGQAVSNLRPYGTAEFFGKTYEVRTHSRYVDRGEKIKVIMIDNHTIFVEPVNKNL
ncbi:NfeD family protein [Roseivirga sp. BDSF3-8]|uniref:NfeD family protein n=1 Tax=Roseivirga sp. BDSF3-8 TaxID=3241598 RepID=UPI0035323CF9